MYIWDSLKKGAVKHEKQLASQGASLEITWFSCPDRTLKIMSQIKFDFLNQLIARSAISLKIKYESQIKSLRKS